VQFSGNITLNPEDVLKIAKTYTQKPYSLINALNLRKRLNELYKTNKVQSTIDLPEFDATTGDLYIHIEEGTLIKKEPALKQSIRYEVSKNIFLLTPKPQKWQEPKWLTTPQKAQPQNEKPVQKPITENQTKSLPQTGNVPKIQEKIIPPEASPLSANAFLSGDVREKPQYQKNDKGLIITNRSDDDLLILELIVDGKALSNGIEAYYDYTTDELFIPLGVLASTLNFPIEINSIQGQMTGFFLSPDNTFELNAPNKSIRIQGKEKPYPKTGLEFSDREIYATPDIIQDWFPLDVKMIYSEQRLELTSRTELPYQAFAKRRNIWDQIKEKNKPREIDAPTEVLQRKWLSKPHIYGALNQSFTKSREDEHTSSTDINLQATGDILQMTGHMNASISHQSSGEIKVDEIKTTLTQVDSNRNLLGPLNASQVELGDVNYQTQPLLNTNSGGRGLFITNKDINAIRDPDNFSLTGNAPAGWDVEIYQNGLILDFQTVATDGTYAFTALPLKKGENIFDVKLFGPNGEKKEYSESYFLGQGVLKRGEFNYDFIATDSADNLIITQDEDDTGKGGLVSLSTEYGLFKNFSVMTGLFSGEINDVEQEAVTAGVRTAIMGTDIQADYITQSNEAKAFQVQVRRNLGNHTALSFSYQNFDGYNSSENAAESVYATTLNKTFVFDYIPNIQTQIRLEHEELLIGESRQNLQTKIGTKIGTLYLTNDLDAIYRETAEDVYSGTFSLTSRFDKFDLRARTSYQISSVDSSIDQLNVGINGKISKSLTVRGDMTQSFDKGLDTTSLNSQLSWKVRKADIGFNLGGTSEGDVNVGFNVSTHLVPEEDDYTFKNSLNAAYGGVQVNLRAFLDDNGNLKYDDNEEVLPDVMFHYKKRGRIARTNNKGVASLTGLSPYIDNIVSVDLLSIKDIYIKPVHEEMNVVGEPYQNGFIEFPMRLEGEVGGIIDYIENGNLQPFSGVRLTLKNQQGETVATGLSEFDGYFLFTGVPMGSHTIHINTEDIDTIASQVRIDKPERIELSKDMPFADGYKIKVTTLNVKTDDIINQALENMQREEIQKPALIE
jgi:hypothetical protein